MMSSPTSILKNKIGRRASFKDDPVSSVASSSSSTSSVSEEKFDKKFEVSENFEGTEKPKTIDPNAKSGDHNANARKEHPLKASLNRMKAKFKGPLRQSHTLSTMHLFQKKKAMENDEATITKEAEQTRLEEESLRVHNWKRWGPYLSDRQWGTVREDYSEDGNCWNYFSHDQSRSRAYRWGEDGLLGISDRQCRMCFGIALWNEKDPILKERLFGLTGPEGNHGEDVKEQYFYLESTPTHSYMKALYKYPQAEFPYEQLVKANQGRPKTEPEFELLDTGIFDESKYFDVHVEYAKEKADDICIKVHVSNRGPEESTIHVLPTLWARNTWSWGYQSEGNWSRPTMKVESHRVTVDHESLGMHHFEVDTIQPPRPKDASRKDVKTAKSYLVKDAEWIFTENESNNEIWGGQNETPYVKDSFHKYVIHKDEEAVNPKKVGTKVACYHVLRIPAGETVTINLRMYLKKEAPTLDIFNGVFGDHFEKTFDRRKKESTAFYDSKIPATLTKEERNVSMQAYAGLLWTKQFYHYRVKEWLKGDPNTVKPPQHREQTGRNVDWGHLDTRDIISMPDCWEYPWFAVWDLAFHCVVFAYIDVDFAKNQLLLMLREWYQHPNGALPAYEFNFSDVNPPVHAWACWRVYKQSGPEGQRDRVFLARVFQKLLLNFTWWVNRKDITGKNIFGGGFLGLDNIGLFDRSKPSTTGYLEQADGTAWMGFYCIYMLKIALELSLEDLVYEDVASKFFEHFVSIADALNTIGGSGLWEDNTGFYADQLKVGNEQTKLPIRSLVGLVPFFAIGNIPLSKMVPLEGFNRRTQWFLNNRLDLAKQISFMEEREHNQAAYLLALPTLERAKRVLVRVFDENEFLSDYGIRSLSKYHKDHPFHLNLQDEQLSVEYVPGESTSGMFGGNSNWRGPIWYPMNFLLIEALERYHHFYGDSLTGDFPSKGGERTTLGDCAYQLNTRLVSVFLPDKEGHRPCHDRNALFAKDPHWKDLVLFYEYFHGDSGKGLGASHQTGWTALAAVCLDDIGRKRMNLCKKDESDSDSDDILEDETESPTEEKKA
eukprot:TRINITY_DN5728_c0_g1_i1.p1 TRINITY_DN5728_c0_g1~~TRINITY_DN5728_c0_g1_i1.p1  ORF type:complete len:1058 (+),score=436.74 TRINITY_DN5728_c0_g1_i1:274-3447(+)